MASWFVSGRPALMAALENVCRQIDEEMEAEVNCNYKDAAIDVRPDPVTHDASVQTDEPDLASPEHLRRSYIKLQRKYEALDKQFKTAKDAIATAKSERSGWRRYAEQLERSINHAQNVHGIEIAVLPLPGTANHELPDAVKEQSAVRGSSVQSTDENLTEHGLLPSTVPGTSPQSHSDQPVSQTHDSTASTQDGSEQGTHIDLPPLPVDSNAAPVMIKQEISSDTPIFVSEKILRKRRRTEEAQPVARAIKSEPSESGSSPLVSLHHCSFVPQESFDLDATAQVVDTPRKRRQLQIMREPTQPEVVPPMAPPPVAAAPASPRVPDATVTPRQPNLSSFSSALTPVDVNRRPQRSAPAASTEKRMKKGLSDGIGSLAEDSGGYRPDGRDRVQMAEAIKGRLDSLLNSPSPAPQSASILRPIRRAKDVQLPDDELGIPKPRALPFDQSGRATPKRPSDVRTPQSTRTPLAETTNNSILRNRQPPKGSLRTKKVAELQLDDFRINPKSNEGLDYAFSDVVRKKDERACLQGCVADDCCGPQFRGLAQAERPKEPLTGLQRQEEQKLLEEYLGDDAWKIGQMGPEERLKTWIEAKARELSNRIGTHKARFTRVRSPPGFWEPDFPTTQEREDEKAEAQRRERQKIEERRREAMRPGGVWVFRDELAK